VKALAKPVLPGTVWRNEVALTGSTRKPYLQKMGDKLRAVAALDHACGGCLGGVALVSGSLAGRAIAACRQADAGL